MALGDDHPSNVTIGNRQCGRALIVIDGGSLGVQASMLVF